jgi:hypothetical protein
MGVEEATLRDPSEEDGGASIEQEPGTIDPAPEKPGCVGAGCPCTDDSGCTDLTYSKCVDGICQGCTTSPDSCPLGRYCLAGTPGADATANAVNECAPGCSSDESCLALGTAAPFCDLSRHQCVACRTNDDCTNPNQECSPSGRCADKCTSDGGTCPNPNEICCDRLCIDPNTDINHCGECGNACAPDQTLCCNGVCVNPLTDADHCGACGDACSRTNGSPFCTAGSCKWNCDPGYHHCTQDNTGCETSTSSNVTQCGGCTNDCNGAVKNASQVACVDNTCTYAGQCAEGFADCDGNKANGCECACGHQNQPCCAGRRCNAGLVCDESNKCVPCGRNNEPCCPGSTCSGGDGRCINGTCRRCLEKNANCSTWNECCSYKCSGVGNHRKCQ